MFNGRRQPSHGGTSRMMREYQVRICERLGVKFLGPTRHSQPNRLARKSTNDRNCLQADICQARPAGGVLCVRGSNSLDSNVYVGVRLLLSVQTPS